MACSNGTVALQTRSTPSETSQVPGELRFKAADGWIEEKTTSSMRVAQYKLPKAAGDEEDGSLVLYYFGQGQGGGTAANIERWVNQMQQPDGRPSKEKAKEEPLNVNGLKVTTVDVIGTYTPEVAPGSRSFYNKPGYRLQAAVVETPKGSYYLKVVGPVKTIGQWEQAIANYIKSFEFH